MNKQLWLRMAVAMVATAMTITARGAIRHVALNGGHAAPYDTWATAATNVQDAVNCALAGDTVLVSNGIYHLGAAVAVSNAIELRGVAEPADAVLVGPWPATNDRCIVAYAACVIANLTITNGVTPNVNGYPEGYGGGILMSSQGIVSNCVIAGNCAEVCGGGVSITGGAVDTCSIIGNRAGNGAGIYMDTSLITNCVIKGNAAWNGAGGVAMSGNSGSEARITWSAVEGNTGTYGGGIHALDNAIVADCTVRNNRSSGDGGGVCLDGAGIPAVASRCTVVGNTAGAYGGGMVVDHGSIASDCVVTWNSAAYGGGVNVMRDSRIDRFTVAHNRASIQGGGLVVDYGSFAYHCRITQCTAPVAGGVYVYSMRSVWRNTLINCLIDNNTATTDAGGMYVEDGILNNCTIAANSAPGAAGLHALAADVSNTIVAGNNGVNTVNLPGSVSYWYSCTEPELPAANDGGNNIYTNPVFAVPGADFHLLPSSPCINTGVYLGWMGSIPDLDGRPRVVGSACDLGPYEYSGGLLCTFGCAPSFGIAPRTVAFSASVTGSNVTPALIAWDVDGDGFADTNGTDLSSLSVMYPTAGVYSVTVWATNDAGETASAMQPQCVNIVDPVIAAFTASPLTGLAPFTVTFTDQSAIEPQYWAWDLDGNGMVDSTNRNPSWTYAATGTFSVTLAVSNNFGAGGASASVLTRTNLIVAPSYPVIADFTATPQTVTIGQPVQFTDTSLYGPDAWAWDFENDGSTDSTARNPSCVYTSAGFKSVRLTASAGGRTSSVAQADYIAVIGTSLVHYVSLHGGHVAPYSTWATAATNAADAVDAAEFGDTVMVSNGIHRLAAPLVVTKSISLCSLSGPGATVLAAAQRTFRVLDLQDVVTVAGLTISNGCANGTGVGGSGGGIIAQAGVIVSNCVLTANTATVNGGGMFAMGGGTIDATVMAGNRAGTGGGLFATGAFMQIAHTVFTSNRAPFAGGAYLGNTRALSCSFINNQGATNAGGACLHWGSVASNCLFRGNNMLDDDVALACAGGGAWLLTNAAVIDCQFVSNRAAMVGGGVVAYDVNLIAGCVFDGNIAWDRGGIASFGGGIMTYGAGTVTNCTLTRNFATMGGGIHCGNGDTVVRCTLARNQARTAGGGGLCSGLITECIFEDNEADQGGGMYVMSSYAVISNCVVRGNRARTKGGGIVAQYGGTFVGTRISMNTAGTEGGGVHMSRDSMFMFQCAMVNCLVENNFASNAFGGGLFSRMELVNCTVAGNYAPFAGGIGVSGAVSLVNCVLAFGGGDACTVLGGANTSDHSCIRWTQGTLVDVGGTIIGEPEFLMNIGDYHLAATSPCINAGTNMAWMAGATDLDGRARIIGPACDMGAFEYGGCECGFISYGIYGIAPWSARFVSAVSGTNGSPLVYCWDFDANGVYETSGVSLTTVDYTYTVTGTYAVALMVSNAAGDYATSVRRPCLTVYPPLSAAFTATPTLGGTPLAVQFTDDSGPQVQQRYWDFNDDGIVDSTVQNPTFTYTATGVYTVVLVVSNDFLYGGRSGSTLRRQDCINVAGRAVVADFSVHPDTTPLYQPVQFTDTSQNGPTWWRWDFEDDGIVDSTEQNPSCTYSSPGHKTVRLVAGTWYSSGIVAKVGAVRVLGSSYVHYVATNGLAIAPYESWNKAARDIQSAVNQAEDGDLVLVSNGVYAMTWYVVIAQGVTVKSVSGPAAAIIRGTVGTEYNVMLAHPFAVLDGFTLTNFAQTWYYGSALLIGESGTVQNCVITGNTNGGDGTVACYLGGTVRNCQIMNNVADRGAGVICLSGGTVSNCTITGNVSLSNPNSSSRAGGGGVLLDRGGLLADCVILSNKALRGAGVCLLDIGTVSNCMIAGNESSFGGGGFHAQITNGTICDSSIWNNRANTGGGGSIDNGVACRLMISNNTAALGGGMYCRYSGAISNSLLVQNTAVSNGGGACSLRSYTPIQSCTFLGNSALWGGGAYVATGTLAACTFDGNTAWDGGGVYIQVTGLVRSSVIAGNVASNSGGGVFCSGDGMVDCATVCSNSAVNGGGAFRQDRGVVRNSILWHNVAVNGSNTHVLGSGVALLYNCSPGLVGDGNIALEPQFSNGYHLALASPCINAGTNFPSMATACDRAGTNRIMHGRADMGAFEFTPSFMRVTPQVVEFGDVGIDATGMQAVVVGNMSGGNLGGSAANAVAPFTVVSGTPYALGGGSTTTVVFAFIPDAQGDYTNVVRFSGGGDVDVILHGTGVPEPMGALFVICYSLFVARKHLSTRTSADTWAAR